MAARRATKNYQAVEEFFSDYETTLLKSMIELDSKCYRGEDLADEIKLDLRFPNKARIGPIVGQVVFRGEDGKVALRLLDFPESIHSLYETLKEKEVERLKQEEIKSQKQAEEIRQKFISEIGKYIEEGLVISMDDHLAIIEQLEVQVEELQAEIAAFRSGQSSRPSTLTSEHEEVTINAVEMVRAKRDRGFFVPSLKGKQALVFGKMETMFQRFLLQVQEKKWTGIFVFQDGDRRRFGFFNDGGLIGFQSNPSIKEERLGDLLLANKQIDQEQLYKSERIMTDNDCLQGEAFVSMGLMNQSQLSIVLKKQIEYILLKLLGIKSGSFQFFTAEIKERQFSSSPLFPVNLLYRKYLERSKAMKAADFSKAMASHLNDEVSFTPQAQKLMKQIPWKEKEQRFLEEILAKECLLRDIFQNSSLSKGHTSAFLWALLQLRFLYFTKKKIIENAEVSKNQEERLNYKIRQIQKGNLFDILEVHWICISSEVEGSYKRLVQEFNPHNPKWDSSASNRVSAVNRELRAAYQKLSVAADRRQYRAKLIKPQMILQSANLLGQKGSMAINKKSKTEAMLCFSKALELNPGQVDLVRGLQKASSL